MKLIKRKECWTLTWVGWISLIVFLGLIQLLFLFNIHPFLSPTKPVKADILIADNCLSDYGLKSLSNEFRSKNYKLIICAGVPFSLGSYLAEYKSGAELFAATLKKIGVNGEVIISVPSKPVEKDRTFASAVAVKNWLDQNNIRPRGINVFSAGTHSRRSWILYKKAFDKQIPVGIIASENLDYDSKRWWRTSIGVRTVIFETIAYIYVKLFFHP